MIADILIDYDNVLLQHRSKGPSHIVSKILSIIDFSYYDNIDRVRVKFYGGWYLLSGMTKEGQMLSSKIQNEFPQFIYVKLKGKEKKVIINAYLATSLEVDPKFTLYHTFRDRPSAGKIIFNKPSSMGCTRKDCPFISIYETFKNKKCIIDDCNYSVYDFISKSEQKMVDSMILSDLIYLASKTKNIIVMVSSDDDILPGMRLAVNYGNDIIHMETRHRKYPSPYPLDNFPNFFTYIM